MDFDAITAKLKEQCPRIETPPADVGDRFAVVPAQEAHAVLKRLKEDPELACDSLMTLAGVDNGRELWVVYFLHSMKHLHKFYVKVLLPRDNPEIESVTALWAAAEFAEREVYDLFGVVFKGHADLRRILNPPDWVGWPGRRDYVFPEAYGGVALAREGQYFSDTIARSVAEREAKDKELLARAAEKPTA
jgi:NADH:ubiquinone oxidoreductase subunit C